MRPRLLLLPLVILLAACSRTPDKDTGAAPSAESNASTSPASQQHRTHATKNARYVDSDNGFSIARSSDFALHRNFHSSYLDNGAWKAFASNSTHGKPLLDMVLNGSNKGASAELRIGSSDGRRALATCLDVPDSATPANADEVQLGGSSFKHFTAADAGMGHYLQLQGYRAVEDGRCLAIDLLIYGVHPQLFDPPATPPFDNASAMQKLHALLQTFAFTRSTR